MSDPNIFDSMAISTNQGDHRDPGDETDESNP
jgi:hypothetical protein